MVSADPVVTVVIPTYNRANTVSRAIESALDQTYENIEVIVVDDGSTDDTPAVVAEYTDDEIMYIRQDDNIGAAAARNVAIQHATGSYISFLDSDDVYLTHRIERMTAALREEPAGCIGVFHSYKQMRPGHPTRVVSVPPRRVGLEELTVRNVVGVLSCTLFEREALEDIGLFDEVLPSSQDYDLYLRLARSYQLRGIDEILTHRYVQNDSISQDLEKKREGHARIEEKHGDILTAHRKSRHNYARFFLHAERGEFGEARRELRTAIRRYPYALRYVYHYVFSFGGHRGLKASNELKARVRRYLP